MSQQKSGETEWYREKLQPHEALIKGWLNSRYSGQIDIDDVVQESLVRVLSAKENGDVESPKAFFFATARNLAIDRVRRSKVVHFEPINDDNDIEVLRVVDDVEGIEETVARNQELEILTEAIQALPERCRRVFTLSKVYGLTYNEIAEELGITFNTVSAQISIGLSKCTNYMKYHGRD